jgi:hypothetical protein
MAGKPRVHQLARELGVTSKAVLAWLSERGVVVQSASSTVEAPVARRLRESYRVGVDEKTGSLAAIQEPPHVYVRDRTSPAAHHRDYLNDRSDEALCGHRFVDPVTLGETGRPSAVCGPCDARLPDYHLRWWRGQYQAANSELAELRVKYRKLKERSDHQRSKLSELQRTVPEVKQKRRKPTVQKARQQKQKSGSTKAAKAQPKPVSSRFARQLGIPVVSKEEVARETHRRIADPERMRKKVKKLRTPEGRGPKTEAEKVSDELARESMRSYKPSSWRLGRSPGSYG